MSFFQVDDRDKLHLKRMLFEVQLSCNRSLLSFKEETKVISTTTPSSFFAFFQWSVYDWLDPHCTWYWWNQALCVSIWWRSV